MTIRAAILVLGSVFFSASAHAQKCKGMEIKYENNIQYPTAARASHLEGEVVLHLQIATDGTIPKIDIVSGPPLLAESAKRFVQSWSITWPKDSPIACDPTLHVSYRLKSDHFNEKMNLPTHITVEAPPITAQ